MNALTRLWSPPPSRARVSDRIYERWVLGMSNVGSKAGWDETEGATPSQQDMARSRARAEERAHEYEVLLQSFAERRIAADAITDTTELIRVVLEISDEAATHGPQFVLDYCRRVARLYTETVR